eukprot:3538079-Pyramimonas_sp.AAC.1
MRELVLAWRGEEPSSQVWRNRDSQLFEVIQADYDGAITDGDKALKDSWDSLAGKIVSRLREAHA